VAVVNLDRNEQTQYLTFHLAGEEYAVAILKIKEIIEYGTITVVPQTPPSVRGVINLRGNVVPVVDLAVKFGMAQSPLTNRTCIVIVEITLNGEPAVLGIIADSVSQVIDVPAHEILSPPIFGTRISADFLLGMAQADKKFLLILDLDRVLAADEVSVALAVGQRRVEIATAQVAAEQNISRS
jgi:purine-binding chemotaxis protein CheW